MFGWLKRFIQRPPASPLSELGQEPQIAFGYKTAWFAITTGDTAGVARILGVVEPKACPWPEGIERAYRGNHVFVTPPVDGWTFAVSFAFLDGVLELPDYPQSKARNAALAQRLEELSSAYGEAFLFGTHRVVEGHSWARAKDGVITRAFVFVGESSAGATRGLITAAEVALGVEDRGWDGGDEDVDWTPNEETVLDVAGTWSLSPASLEGRLDLAESVGLFGPAPPVLISLHG